MRVMRLENRSIVTGGPELVKPGASVIAFPAAMYFFFKRRRLL